MDNPGTLTQFLANYVTLHKQQRIADVLQQRTRHISVVLENIYQPHNASAVVRSCDCFGVQDVHIIEGRNKYEVNPHVVRGSAKWVSIIKHQESTSPTNCFATLKKNGYRLVGTSPQPNSTPLNRLDITPKTALVFGTEETGLSKFALQQMDELVHIPMHGFTESFNISVSVAICLYEVTSKLRSLPVNWHLTPSEIEALTLDWYKNIVPKPEVLEREFTRLNQSTS